MVQRLVRLLKRILRGALIVVGIYAFVLLIGLVPVNNDFQPPENGITIILVSSAVHADLILPITTPTIDWRDQFAAEHFIGETSSATHVAFGWGDKGFFLNTPTWSDLKASTAVKALLWSSDSCLRVRMTNETYSSNTSRSVTITSEQYAELVEFIIASFRKDKQGKAIPINGFSYGVSDAFFEAHGSYNCVNTCNTWVGQALKSSGVRTPWLTPLPKTALMYLPSCGE